MKKLIFLIFCLFSISTFAQQVKISEYVEVVDLPNMSKNQIFNTSKIWIAKSFKSSNSVIQYEDSATGTIVGKGNMQFPCQGTWSCMAHKDDILVFTIKIDTKDNKARISFNDMTMKINTKGATKFVAIGQEIQTVPEKDNDVIQLGLKNIVQDFKNGIHTESSDSNW
ncbi:MULTISPECIES: DUF4468 domain-containing protein [Acinetobacter calcoaceticus/baumannii complex]|nr:MULTISPECIES: DUF4468 domain-containing protein [Acinetobacter calcoaceticus/baumannii complex]EGK48486.1 hypothetical protein AB210_0774 [Acinetobacter baumannii AB210]ELY0554896.1 DUF4468 domain-containing protein [Acinetobacter baumannii]KZC89238.1 hypothetical protein WM39_09455 [Acinetobacter baumannii]MBP4147074.1 DUF4468 domain-containing protein [Acinetobacter baumannii]MBP4198989.1 DUF4468 domain-containing protein [Acinetobacter baumannii]